MPPHDLYLCNIIPGLAYECDDMSQTRVIGVVMPYGLGRLILGEIGNNYVPGNFFMYLTNIIRLQCFKTVKT